MAKNKTTLGMKWYKFTIYFALFLGALSHLVMGFQYVSGMIYAMQSNYEVTAQQVYAYYGKGLQVTDIVYGVILFALAVLAIIVRQKLAKFRPDAIKFLIIFYAINIAATAIYSIVSAIIIPEQSALTSLGGVAPSIVIVIINVMYFKKRVHLFSGEAQPAETITDCIPEA